jgi:hypothetical protein
MGGTFISVNEQLAQQALDTIETLKSQLAEANARIDALTKGRGGMKKSAVERLAELELRDRGEAPHIGLLEAAIPGGNLYENKTPAAKAVINGLTDPAELRKATAAAKARKARKR